MDKKYIPGPWTTNSYSRIECSVPYGSPWDRFKPDDEGPNINGDGFAIIGYAAQRPDHEGRGDELHSEEARANINLMAAAPTLVDIALAAINLARRLHADPFIADALEGAVDAAVNGTDSWLSLEAFAKKHGLDQL